MIFREKINPSLLFLLPLIADNNRDWSYYLGPDGMDNDSYFINAYSSDINSPFLDNHVLLMFDSKQLVYSNTVNLERARRYRNKYSMRIDGKFYTILSFEIDEEDIRDKNMVLAGDYSHATADYKARVLSFWPIAPDSDIFKELYLSEKIFPPASLDEIKEKDYLKTREDIMEEMTTKKPESA